MSSSFKGEKWSYSKDAVLQYGLNWAESEEGIGLGKNKIRLGGNSGYQAINLCYLKGAKRIILLGYDMQRTGGKSHHHGDHPGHLSRSSSYGAWVKNFRHLASDLKGQGVEVLNATRETALDSFQKVNLEDVI